MFKKRIMLLSLLTLFSLGILASCGDSEEYVEIGLDFSSKNNSHNGFYVYGTPLNLGFKYKMMYGNSVDIEIYYGINPYSSKILKNEAIYPPMTAYSDLEQELSLRICRISGLTYRYPYNTDSSMMSSIGEEIFSVTDTMRNLFVNDEYVFNINNKIVDTIDYNFIKEKCLENKYISYYAEIKSPKDEYIKYLIGPVDEDYNPTYDESDGLKIHSPFKPNEDYTKVKTLCSIFQYFKVFVHDDDEEIKLLYSN